jgi:hypothetical protein
MFSVTYELVAVGINVPSAGAQGGNVDSRTEQNETTISASTKISRHVMLSTTRGVTTELELSDVPGADASYVIRHWPTSDGVGLIMESGCWIGFRYHDTHWSFVEQ